MALAFEIQHGVDDVLERLRPREAAVFRHVANEKRRDVLALRSEQQLGRRFADLARILGALVARGLVEPAALEGLPAVVS